MLAAAGLLPILAEGKSLPEMDDAVAMTDSLKADLNHMLQEHKKIVAALKILTEAAKRDRKR